MTIATEFPKFLPSDGMLLAHRRSDPPPRFAELNDELRGAAVELVREGYELHYGTGRYHEIADPDLALLAGDRHYAAGLAVLAENDDVEAVAILAKLIADCAEAQAAAEPSRCDRLWHDALAILAPSQQ